MSLSSVAQKNRTNILTISNVNQINRRKIIQSILNVLQIIFDTCHAFDFSILHFNTKETERPAGIYPSVGLGLYKLTDYERLARIQATLKVRKFVSM